MFEPLHTQDMLTVYAQASKATLSEMRAFLRERGLGRPKLGRLPVQVQPYRPYITFEFQDERDAVLFRFMFDVREVRPETVSEIDAAERERIEEGIRRLNQSREVQERWRRNLSALGSL